MDKNLRTFLVGMGSVLQLFPPTGGGVELPPALRRYANHPQSVEEAFDRDREALASDWLKIGDDFRHAMSKAGDVSQE